MASVAAQNFVLTHKEAIEKFVNSKEAEELLGDDNFYEAWNEKLRPRLITILGADLPEEVEEPLYRDLRDWWKNGNFYHWEADAVNNFGMGAWELGDEDFWN